MNNNIQISRRSFLKIAGGVGTGLTLGISLGCTENTSNNAFEAAIFTPNAWLNIDNSGGIVIFVDKSEMGQGVMTSMPMLVAEELEVDFAEIEVRMAPISPEFGNRTTAGSHSIRHGWVRLREVGAAARQMLISAAARAWGVPDSECKARLGHVMHDRSQRRISYAELAEPAARLEVPETITLKPVSEFRLIGKSTARVDIGEKIDGSAVFGIDVQLPGLLSAAIRHCPVFGGKVASLDSSATLKIPGVKEVVQLGEAVAVVANDYWTASKGLDALQIEWQESPDKANSSASIQQSLYAALEQQGDVVRETGDINHSLQSAASIVEAVYELPFQAHATMEPMCCTAHVQDGICEIWAPTQHPGKALDVAGRQVLSEPALIMEKVKRRLFNEPLDSVKLNLTYLGGGFGRRLNQDFVVEAVKISQAVQAPVKLIWSREEDMQHDFYHPMNVHRLRAGLDHNGRPVAWSHHAAGPHMKAKGAADLPYNIPAIQVVTNRINNPIPIGNWRSVHNHYNAFVTECFIDELAAAGGQDPLELRLQLLADSPRHKAVLERAAQAASWGKSMPDDRAQGLAFHYSFGAYTAQVMELSVADSGKIRVHKVVCAIDCGIAVNPDTIKAQIEGAVAWGLTAALKSEITLANGRVEQSNFHDNPLLRINEMPVVETIIIPSNEKPGGVGEPGVPPVAPALANAVYRATGVRVRSLPIRPETIRAA
jgi:isoquinoline 1-oxidoreductase subunit beta